MSTKPSLYEAIEIESADVPGRTADLRLGVVSIDIYENILVPTLSARINVVDSGGSIKDLNGDRNNIYEGLPIKGKEKVTIYIRPNSATNLPIDFTIFPLINRTATNVNLNAKRQSFSLELISQAGVANELSSVVKVYGNEILASSAVESILKENIGQLFTYNIDRTVSMASVAGNKRKAFSVVTNLASKSVSAENSKLGQSAGFFFYETRRGINFKSIDSLVSQDPVAEFFYSEVNINEADFVPTPNMPSLDAKILSYTVHKTEDIIQDLRNGTYATRRVYFNPITQKVTTRGDGEYKPEKYSKGMGTLGDQQFAKFNEKTPLQKRIYSQPSRYLNETFAFGTFAKGVSQESDDDLIIADSQSLTRYNSLFSQCVSILTPLNTRCHAGDVVVINIPKSGTNKGDTYERDTVSGRYIIKELCHHYEATGSFSSMKLIRDTSGYRGVNSGKSSLGLI